MSKAKAQPILARRYPGISRYYHFDHPVRAVTATNGHINRIIQHRQIREQRIQSMLVENNREAGSERDRISRYIRDLSFQELKRKLKEKGLSARGYLRTSLEERLYKRIIDFLNESKPKKWIRTTDVQKILGKPASSIQALRVRKFYRFKPSKNYFWLVK